MPAQFFGTFHAFKPLILKAFFKLLGVCPSAGMQAVFPPFSRPHQWAAMPWHCGATLMSGVHARRQMGPRPHHPAGQQSGAAPTALPMGACPLAALNPRPGAATFAGTLTVPSWRAERCRLRPCSSTPVCTSASRCSSTRVIAPRHAPHPHRTADFDYGKTRCSPKAGATWGLGWLHHHLIRPRTRTSWWSSQAPATWALGAPAVRPVGLGLAIDTVAAARRGISALYRVLAGAPATRRHAGHRLCAHGFAPPPGPTASTFSRAQTVTTVRTRILCAAAAQAPSRRWHAPLTSMFLFGENQPRKGRLAPRCMTPTV